MVRTQTGENCSSGLYQPILDHSTPFNFQQKNLSLSFVGYGLLQLLQPILDYLKQSNFP